jgi:hypothetical protein
MDDMFALYFVCLSFFPLVTFLSIYQLSIYERIGHDDVMFNLIGELFSLTKLKSMSHKYYTQIETVFKIFLKLYFNPL